MYLLIYIHLYGYWVIFFSVVKGFCYLLVSVDRSYLIYYNKINFNYIYYNTRTGTTTGIKQSLVPKRALLRIWLIRIWGFTQHGLCFGYWNLDSGLSIISFIKDEFFISVAGSQVLRTQLPVCNALLWRLFQYLPKRDCDLLSATH